MTPLSRGVRPLRGRIGTIEAGDLEDEPVEWAVAAAVDAGLMAPWDLSLPRRRVVLRQNQATVAFERGYSVRGGPTRPGPTQPARDSRRLRLPGPLRTMALACVFAVTTSSAGTTMGALHTYLHRIPEARLEGLMAYFSTAQADVGRIGPDLEAFLQAFPAGNPGEPRPLAPEVRAEYVQQVVDRFEVGEQYRGRMSADCWREYAVYDALRYFATGQFYVGTSLAEDLQGQGDCWPYLDATCQNRGDREAVDLLLRLMFDDSPGDFLPCVELWSARTALLRPAETRRLLDAIPLLERFYAAIPEPAGSGTTGAGAVTSRSRFREELRALIDEMKSWGDEPTCLVSSAETS